METVNTAPAELKLIPLSQLKVSDQNLRDSGARDDEEWLEFVESIRNKGVLEPLIVVKAVDGYEVIAGSRRLRALQQIYAACEDKTEPLVPCSNLAAKSCEAIERIAISAQENVQRRSLTPKEGAKIVSTLKDMGQNQEQIAALLGKSPAWVSLIARGKPLHEHRIARKLRRKDDGRETFKCPCCGKALIRLGKNHYDLDQATDEAIQTPVIAGNHRESSIQIPEQHLTKRGDVF